MPSKTIEDFAYQIKDYMRSAEVVEGKNLYDITNLEGRSNTGITWDKQTDGSIVLNGTNTSGISFIFPDTPNSSKPLQGVAYNLKPNTDYVVSIGENIIPNVYIQIAYTTNYQDNWPVLFSGQNVNVASFTTPSSFADLWIQIYIPTGASVSNTTIYPMICTLAEWQKSHTYEPYYVPVKDRSEVKVINASYTGASSTIKDISLDVQRVGKVVQFAIYFVTNTYVNAGATVELTLVNCPLPSYSGMRIIGFSGTYELIGWIESTGKVKIRFFGNTNEGASIVLAGTYLTND